MTNSCRHCGQPLVPGVAFCGNCGTAVAQAPAPALAPTPQPAQPEAIQPVVIGPQTPPQPVVTESPLTPEVPAPMPALPRKSSTGKIVLIVGLVIGGVLLVLVVLVVLASSTLQTEDSQQSANSLNVGDSENYSGQTTRTYLTEQQVSAIKDAINGAASTEQLSTTFKDQFSQALLPVTKADFVDLCLSQEDLVKYATIEPGSGNQFVTEADLPRLKQSVNSLVDELAIYPIEFLALAKPINCFGFTKAIAGENNTITRANTNGLAVVYTLEAERHTIHHELFHSIEKQVFVNTGKKVTDWPTPDSDYSTSLQEALQSATKPGFVSPYASSAPHEDRAETYAYIMVPSAPKFADADASNTVLAQKIKAVKRFLYDTYPGMNEEFYTKATAP